MVAVAGYRIDVGACDPESCGYLCQEVCPTGVFLAAPKKKLADHSVQPEYKVVPRFAYFCNGCMDCVEQCPEHAIKVKGPA